MKVVVVGVFDIFHIGHFNFLEKAKKLGDALVVGVHDDKLNIKGVEFLYSLRDRIRIIEALEMVHEALPYERVDLFLKDLDFDVFAYGPDQSHRYFEAAKQFCVARGKRLVEISRTEGISSSQLREFLNKKTTFTKG
jgi:glycerol-3-phosphate cytidylyltransferase